MRAARRGGKGTSRRNERFGGPAFGCLWTSRKPGQVPISGRRRRRKKAGAAGDIVNYFSIYIYINEWMSTVSVYTSVYIVLMLYHNRLYFFLFKF